MNKRFVFPRLGSRYRALIVFIALFVFSIISVLALNFYISSEFNEDALEINIAGRQRMLSQRTVKALLDLQNAKLSGAAVERPLLELKSSTELFDNTIRAFDVGGETLDTSDQPAVLSPVDSAKSREYVNAAQKIWKDYRAKLQPLLEGQSLHLKNLSEANRLILGSNEELLAQMNELTQLLESSKADGALINIAGRQRLLTQLLVKNVSQLSSANTAEDNVVELVDSLKQTRNLFDTTLTAFVRGGELVGADGGVITIESLPGSEVQSLLARVQAVWFPLNTSLQQVVSAKPEDLGATRSAISFALANNLDLLASMNGLTTNLQAESESRSQVMRIIQIVGIAISLLMFSIILFYFVRQLRSSDDELEEAKAETDRIMATVNDGLFLLDSDLNIGGQHSSSIVDILDLGELEGQNFLALLKKIVPQDTLNTAKDYLALLFGDRVYEELVTDLNPLNSVRVHLSKQGGESQTKYLQFEFKRVLIDEQVSHLLVQVEDVSKQVLLEEELEKSQEKAQRQLDLMLKVLHVEPQSLAEYLNSTEESLREINEVLSERTGSSKNRTKIERMFRTMHAIKGDSSALELDFFAERAHEFENELDKLKLSDNTDGVDFLPLTIQLDEFLSQVESLRVMIERMGDLRKAVQNSDAPSDSVTDGAQVNSENHISTKLENFTARLSEKRGKIAAFSMHGEASLPVEYRRDVDEVLTQLVRNSLVHGIEDPEVRRKAQKPVQGSIRVSISVSKQGEVELRFHDDGQGLSPENIKKTALEKGLITQATADKLSNRQAASLILKSGFSSADDVDEDAGRGVGMDVIRSRIAELGGNLKIRYSEGRSCEFIATLPSFANEKQ